MAKPKKGTNHTYKKSELARKGPCPRTKGDHEERLTGFGAVENGRYDRTFTCRRCHQTRRENVSADTPRTITK